MMDKKNSCFIFMALFILVGIGLVLPQVFNNGPYSSFGQNPNFYSNNLNTYNPNSGYDLNRNQNYNQFNNGLYSNNQYQSYIAGQYNSNSVYNNQFNSPSRNVQYLDPRYQSNFNNGYYSYNQYGQSAYTQPSGAYGASGLFGYGQYGSGNYGFNQQLCSQGQNFLIAIAPGGCSPAVVRSDLLEEQNVPVYCRLSSLQTNSLLSGTRIRGVRVAGELPLGISGVSYFPSRAAISGQNSIFGGGLFNTGGFGTNSYYNQYNTGYNNYGAYGLNSNYGSFGSGSFFNNNGFYGSSNLIGSPINDDLGYLVIVLTRAANESTLPDFVEGNITATIDYDSAGLFGVGQTTFYLDTMDEAEWQRNYRENSFWNGQAYIRANAVDQNTATISIYRDQNVLEQTFTLREGETSPPIQVGGNYCSAGMSVRLDSLRAPTESVLLQVNGEQKWVAESDRIINNRCTVRSIVSSGTGGKVSISCPGSSFDLNLNGGKATLEVGESSTDVIINGLVRDKDNLYLGYLGRDLNSGDLAVLVRDGVSNNPESFADKEVFNAVENVKDKSNDDKIVQAVVSQYKIKVPKAETPKVYVLRNGNSIEGIKLLNLYTIQDSQDFNKNPTAQIYYDRSINYYRELSDLYPNEKIAEGEVTLAAKGLSEAFELSRQFQLNSQANEFSDKLRQDYDDVYLSEYVGTESNYLFKYDRTNAKKIVQVDNSQYSIDLLEFKKPSRLDASGSFLIDGTEVTLGLGEFYSSGETRFQLLNLDNDRVSLGYEYSDANGNRVSNRETLIFGTRSQTSINGVNVRLNNVNLMKQAKVTLTPNLLGTGSRNQVNFPVRIGIEKRAIELSPEKTRDAIDNLNEAIAEWKEINDKLGTVISTLKAACFATSSVLTVKNLFEGATGSSVARNRLMTSSGGWNDKCEELVNNGQYVSVQQCLLDKNSEIERDIEIFSKEIQGTNGVLRDISEQVGIEHEGAFDFQGQTDAKEVERIFGERFNEFCQGNSGSVSLPGQGGGSVSYSEICDWEGMTHEQRREILTLTNIKNSEGSEVLQDYTNRELGRITLEAKSTNELRIAQIESESNSERLNLDVKALNPVGDRTTLGDIKTITESDKRNGGVYNGFESKDNVVRVYVPSSRSIGEGDNFDGGSVGGQEVLVKVSEVDGSGGVYSPEGSSRIYTIDGRELSDNEANKVREYMGLAGIDRVKRTETNALKNKMVDTSNLRVKYFDRAPFKGLPSIVPFDVNEGWYVKTSYTLAGFGVPYEESGRAANYYICNVGSNGLVEFKKNSDDICRYYNGFNQDLSFPGLSVSESASLVRRAQAALQDATRQFGSESVNINGQNFKSGVSFDETDGQCTDFMSASDCNILFNVCDPVICPTSRCDLGGDYRVDNVIQTGIVGSLALCLPNLQEGIAVPICLTGVHAGLDGYISILNSTSACLTESLETGRNIGICDEIKSVYMCDFFWRQAAPFFEVLLQKTFEVAAGQGARGGGEYLTVQNAWSNTENAIGYFTGQYAQNSIQAFYSRNLGDVQPIGSFGSGAYGGVGYSSGTPGYSDPYLSSGAGGFGNANTGGFGTGGVGTGGGYGGNVGAEICKSFISTGVSGTTANLFESLVAPDSPEQYTGWFSEFPTTTATVPPQSQYKVYYHIFAGKDIGASYQVYLKGVPQSAGIFSNGIYVVDQGYIARGSEVDRARDFTATSGFRQLCININGREECGFGQVSTSFALNSITDAYLEEQTSQTDIVSETNCIAGSSSLYSLAQPNIQTGVESVLNPQLYNKGIVRICSTKNPGEQVLPSGKFDSTNSVYDRWKDVGYCDDPTIRCWLDTNSVKDRIRNSGVENRVLGEINLNHLNGGEYFLPDQSEAILSEANQLINDVPQVISPSESQTSIDGKISRVVHELEVLSSIGPNNLYRARALYLLGNIHRVIANLLFLPDEILLVDQGEFSSIDSSGGASGDFGDGDVEDEDVGRNQFAPPVSQVKIDRSKNVYFNVLEVYSDDLYVRYNLLSNKWEWTINNPSQNRWLSAGASGHVDFNNLEESTKAFLNTLSFNGYEDGVEFIIYEVSVDSPTFFQALRKGRGYVQTYVDGKVFTRQSGDDELESLLDFVDYVGIEGTGLEPILNSESNVVRENDLKLPSNLVLKYHLKYVFDGYEDFYFEFKEGKWFWSLDNREFLTSEESNQGYFNNLDISLVNFISFFNDKNLESGTLILMQETSKGRSPGTFFGFRSSRMLVIYEGEDTFFDYDDPVLVNRDYNEFLRRVGFTSDN